METSLKKIIYYWITLLYTLNIFKSAVLQKKKKNQKNLSASLCLYKEFVYLLIYEVI